MKLPQLLLVTCWKRTVCTASSFSFNVSWPIKLAGQAQTPHAAPTSNSVAPLQPRPEPAVVPLQPNLPLIINATGANTPAGADRRQLALPLSNTQAPCSKGFQQHHLQTQDSASLRLPEFSAQHREGKAAVSQGFRLMDIWISVKMQPCGQKLEEKEKHELG